MDNSKISFIDIRFSGETENYGREILLDQVYFTDDQVIEILHRYVNNLTKELGEL